MATMTHEYCDFPNTVLEQRTFKDVTDDIAAIINQYKAYMAAGQYNLAAKYYADNESAIKDCIVDMEYFNSRDEHIRNCEIYALQQGQYTYIQEEEPTNVNDNDLWLGGDWRV